MIDIVTLGIVLVVAAVVLLRKTSAGVAILGLLAGVMLDQLLSDWVINMLPKQASTLGIYLPVIVHLLLTFIPVIAILIAVRVHKHNAILSLLTSIVLGFLMVLFGLKIVAPLPAVKDIAKNSGLFTLLNPYQNTILAMSAVLALIEMVFSHRSKSSDGRKKRK